MKRSTVTKERPILFTPENVRKILDGLKTQTRRVIKPQPIWMNESCFGHGDFHVLTNHASTVEVITCPFGQVGDRLWVREAAKLQDVGPGRREFTINYKADTFERSDARHFKDQERGPFVLTHWTPSIFMPRWASRLTLEITAIRVERVQEISKEDAVDEGYPNKPTGSHEWRFVGPRVLRWYKDLWNSSNAKRGHGWNVNPWVWALTFKEIN